MLLFTRKSVAYLAYWGYQTPKPRKTFFPRVKFALARFLTLHLDFFESTGVFLKGPKKFLHSASNSKIATFLIRFFSRILIVNMNIVSLHTISFRCVYFSDFRYRWTQNGIIGPKSFWGPLNVDYPGVPPEKLGGGVRPASHNPYPFSLVSFKYCNRFIHIFLASV